jgi:predicted membrane channel-forming protein YqfA (hemolysin III family)
LTLLQLFFAFACLAFSVAACVFVRGSIALLIAIIGSAIAMVDASYGWHAITSKIAKKRNTILGWDYAGLLGLIAATVCLKKYDVLSKALMLMMFTDFTCLWLHCRW